MLGKERKKEEEGRTWKHVGKEKSHLEGCLKSTVLPGMTSFPPRPPRELLGFPHTGNDSCEYTETSFARTGAFTSTDVC